MASHLWKPKNGELPPEKMEILCELNEAFDGDSKLINAYIEKFSWSKVISPNIRIIRREFAESQNVEKKISKILHRTPEEKEEKDNNHKRCYYEVVAKCVFCGEELMPKLIKSKALIITYSYKKPDFPLFVPEAKSAMHGYDCVDPVLFGVIMCPNCLFASTTISNFQTDSAVSGVRGILARVPERKLATLKKFIAGDTEKRRELFSSIDLSCANEIGKADALKAYLVASHCSELMVDHDTTEYFRAADALLSAARLANDLDMEVLEMNCLRKAVPLLEHSFEEGSISALPVYLLGVIHYHLGDLLSARTWIGRVLTDRGKLVASSKYKRFCENLNEKIKSEK